MQVKEWKDTGKGGEGLDLVLRVFISLMLMIIGLFKEKGEYRVNLDMNQVYRELMVKISLPVVYISEHYTEV